MFRAVVDLLFVFGPSTGYVVQANTIQTTRSAAGYSLESSLILLLCNSLRIIYFVGEPFAIALLFQSFVMIAVQTILVLTVLKINMANAAESTVITAADSEAPEWLPSGGELGSVPSIIAQPGALPRLGESATAIAHWTPRQFVTSFILAFATTAAISFAVFTVVPSAARVMGYVAMGVEAMLIVPQIRLNRQRRSCEGLAMTLVCCWVFGDLIKAVYFVVLSQPAPFIVCVGVQLCIDAVLVGQLVAYRTPSAVPFNDDPVEKNSFATAPNDPLALSGTDITSVGPRHSRESSAVAMSLGPKRGSMSQLAHRATKSLSGTGAYLATGATSSPTTARPVRPSDADHDAFKLPVPA